jgi:Icc protein
MHHPPFATGITHMDNFGLDNAAELAEIVVRHPQVERILCGHLHRTIDRRFAGTVAGTAPSTAHQIRLNLSLMRGSASFSSRQATSSICGSRIAA